jgi:hypothetical protein
VPLVRALHRSCEVRPCAMAGGRRVRQGDGGAAVGAVQAGLAAMGAAVQTAMSAAERAAMHAAVRAGTQPVLSALLQGHSEHF